MSGIVSPLSRLQGSTPQVFDSTGPRLHCSGWIKPDEGWLKVNVDGAVCHALGASCDGVVRDHEGRWVKGFSRNLGYLESSNVFLIELLAVRTSMEMIMGLNLPQVKYLVVFFINSIATKDLLFNKSNTGR
ncbi:uncharacterized protein LOC130728056 [Lotus japonicus]|uniref:uncharacterized protein LOC130728056 n=1 Tax=Lotus japonicus TaxID=34305 RepID=UPI00258FB30F|nr:uncharacterized protein LOC130728056 [Lotus japonicus]